MKEAILLLMHLLTRVAMLFGTSGSRALLAENILLKQQLMVLRRSRRRAPRLRAMDRLLFGVWTSFLNPRRLLRAATSPDLKGLRLN